MDSPRTIPTPDISGDNQMKPISQNQPRVTIVVTERERHSLALRTLESIVANTPRPYHFLYLDSQSPAWLREELSRRQEAWGLKVIRFEQPLWPQEARHRVAGRLDTEFVVFIDNDVLVEPGWLDSLVACADETGAGVVGPLYLWSDGASPPSIHMAGGKLTEAPAEHGRVLAEAHCLVNEYPDRVAAELFRQPTDFVEYHCLLIRTELLGDGTLLDPNIRCVHEHIDTALTARQRGHPVYFEPASRVNHLAFVEYMLDDLATFRKRWRRSEAEASIAAFCEKWGVVNDDRSFMGVRQFIRNHNVQIDPIRPALRAHIDATTAMRREELRQTRSDLLDAAMARGYNANELVLLANAYHLAQVLMDGGYRPCGRPFINHLAGTASVLIRYGFRAEIVAAGLLHSAYSHCPAGPGDPKAALEAVCTELGGKGSVLEKRVRAYTRRDLDRTVPPVSESERPTLSMLDAEAIAIATANEVDMHLSGEFRYSGRTDALKAEAMRQVAHVCAVLGVPGLYDTLLQAQDPQAVPEILLTRIPGSYRIGQDKRHAVSMVSIPQSALAELRP